MARLFGLVGATENLLDYGASDIVLTCGAGGHAITIGNNAIAVGFPDVIAIGNDSHVGGTGRVAIGNAATAIGQGAVSLGDGAISGVEGLAVGTSAVIKGNAAQCVVIGKDSQVGTTSGASSTQQTVVGFGSKALGDLLTHNTLLGSGLTANHSGVILVGVNLTSSEDNEINIGGRLIGNSLGITWDGAPIGGGIPGGAAGGSLAGTYPNPTIAAGAVTGTEIAAAVKDPAAGTAGLRTLSNTGTTACAGNDSRLSDSRAPNGAAGGSLAGTYPNPTIAAGAAIRTIPVLWNSVVDGLTGGFITASRTATNETRGVIWYTQKAITINGIRFYWKRGAADRTVKAALWSWTNNGAGTLITSVDVSVTADGDYTGTFSAPQAMAANSKFVVSIWEKSGTDATKYNIAGSNAISGPPASAYLETPIYFPQLMGYRLWILYMDRSGTGDVFPGTGNSSSQGHPIEPVIADLTSL